MVVTSVQQLYDMKKDLSKQFGELESKYENTPGLTEKERDNLLEQGLDVHYELAVIKDIFEYLES